MTHAQVQAKLDIHPGLMEDYVSFLVSFALVCCFTTVFPEIALVALLTNLVELRLLAYRNVFATQRVFPHGSDGPGGWMDFLEFIGKLVVFVNCGLACFILEPLRDYDFSQKLVAFVLSEHL